MILFAIVLICTLVFWHLFLSDYSRETLNNAVWYKCPHVVRFALRLGADIGQEKDRDIGGITVSPPLLGAVMTDQDEIAEELLKRGARTDSLYGEGYGLLEWCVQFDRLDTARLLLRYGADPDQKTFHGSAMEVAQGKGKTNFVEMFKKISKSR